MAVFTAFSDESATPDSDGAFLVGGYAATETEWPYFANAWCEFVLNSHPNIPYLHMVEIRSNKFRSKHNLGRLQASDKVEEAVRVIECTGSLSAFVGRLDRSNMAEFKGRLKLHKILLGAGVDEPDYICFLAYAWITLNHLWREFGDRIDQVDFVVSRKKKVSHYCEKYVDHLRSFLEAEVPEVSHLVGDLIPASMEMRVPLQAADVLVWHFQRYYAKNLDRMDTLNLIRLGETPGGVLDFDKKLFRQFSRGTIRTAKRELGITNGTNQTKVKQNRG